MKRAMATTLLGILAAASVARADVSEDVRTLARRRAVQLPDDGAAGWYAVVEDSLLAAGCRPGLTDLRLTDADGRSLPLRVEPPSRARFRYRTLREEPVVWTAAERGSREMTVDLGDDVPPRLTVELTGLSAATPVQVMGRDSEEDEWVLLPLVHDADAGPPEPPEPRGVSRIEVAAPRRYLRLVQERASAPGSEDQLRLLTREALPGGGETVGFHASPGRFTSGGNQWQTVISLDGPARAVSGLQLRWAEPRGARSWRLEARLPRGGWRFQTGGGEADGEQVSLPPVRTDAVRLTVTGADAPNVPCEVAQVQVTPQRWVFRVDRPESLWVAYGDRWLETSSAQGEAPPRDAVVREAALGPPEPNPFRREPAFGLEWLRRRPTVVGAVMIALLALVTWLAVGRRASRPGTDG